MKPPIIGQSSPKASPSAGVLAAMAVVASGFYIVIKIGFIIHGQPAPPPFDSHVLTFAAAVVLLVVLGFVLFQLAGYLRWQRIRARLRAESRRSHAERAEARRLRVAELLADPLRAKYAPLVERGEDWPNDHIDYVEDPDATVLCAHLMPIEREMRRTGIELRRYREHDVTAKCRIESVALNARFAIAPPVRYAEFEQGERGERDYLFAFLICDEHKCVLHTVHPDEGAARGLPVFPDSGVSESIH